MIIKKLILAICFFGLFLLVCCQQSGEKQSNVNNSPEEQSIASKDIVTPKMVHVPAGTFQMGTDDPAFPDAHPVHKVSVKEFWMDEHEVTNAQFAEFVKVTGYITTAERKPE